MSTLDDGAPASGNRRVVFPNFGSPGKPAELAEPNAPAPAANPVADNPDLVACALCGAHNGLPAAVCWNCERPLTTTARVRPFALSSVAAPASVPIPPAPLISPVPAAGPVHRGVEQHLGARAQFRDSVTPGNAVAGATSIPAKANLPVLTAEVLPDSEAPRAPVARPSNPRQVGFGGIVAFALIVGAGAYWLSRTPSTEPARASLAASPPTESTTPGQRQAQPPPTSSIVAPPGALPLVEPDRGAAGRLSTAATSAPPPEGGVDAEPVATPPKNAREPAATSSPKVANAMARKAPARGARIPSKAAATFAPDAAPERDRPRQQPGPIGPCTATVAALGLCGQTATQAKE